MSTNTKIKITQQEINDIYEIDKDEPFPPVKEVKVEETPLLTEEEQIEDDKLFEDYIVPPEEET